MLNSACQIGSAWMSICAGPLICIWIFALSMFFFLEQVKHLKRCSVRLHYWKKKLAAFKIQMKCNDSCHCVQRSTSSQCRLRVPSTFGGNTHRDFCSALNKLPHLFQSIKAQSICIQRCECVSPFSVPGNSQLMQWNSESVWTVVISRIPFVALQQRGDEWDGELGKKDE